MITNKPSPEVEDIAYKILHFYELKFNFNREEINKALNALSIVNIKLQDDTIVIELGRPGLLIGPKGSNIDALEKFLNLKVKVVESFTWSNILTSYDPEHYFQ